MAELKKYSLQGKNLGAVSVPDELATAEVHQQLLKDYVVALRANKRQWSANTKGRSEVSHSTKKPHPQKGGGRARQGSLAAPQYKGGGRVFGPKPKFDQHVKVNRKEKLAAMRALVGMKIRDDKILVLDSTEMAAPKTQVVVDFLKSLNLEGKRVLFIGEGAFESFEFDGLKINFNVPVDQHSVFLKSMRNVPKLQFVLAGNVNGYDLMLAHQVVITEKAMKEWQDWLVT